MKINIRDHILLSALIFFLFIFVGVAFSGAYPDLIPQVVNDMSSRFQPLAQQDPSFIFLYIFLNNSLIDFTAIILFFLFGLASLYLLITNGFTIGIVLNAALKRASAAQVAAALLPHGIIEIPAFLISMGYGLWLGAKFYKKIAHKEPFKEHFYHALRVFFGVIVILNFLAALIEVYVTPVIFRSI